jgi:hypothetical protein
VTDSTIDARYLRKHDMARNPEGLGYVNVADDGRVGNDRVCDEGPGVGVQRIGFGGPRPGALDDIEDHFRLFGKKIGSPGLPPDAAPGFDHPLRKKLRISRQRVYISAVKTKSNLSGDKALADGAS